MLSDVMLSVVVLNVNLTLENVESIEFVIPYLQVKTF